MQKLVFLLLLLIFREGTFCENFMWIFILLCNSRLITCEADKSIKIWKENAHATETSDPVDMKTWTRECLALKRH
jgi:hypothetical protein